MSSPLRSSESDKITVPHPQAPAENGRRRRARLIAFYLPQFHPIPENDRWWGEGFTEWTNVARARPLFRGHIQPRLPGELGFYDLRLPETRAAQAELAAAHGIEGFCYWHYWFAGRRLLQRPFEEVVWSGEPEFPFCLAWANQSWTGTWHGAPEHILIEQTYPGRDDYINHFRSVLPAFTDRRYLTVEGKPLFFVFRAEELPEPRAFTDLWRELAVRAGLSGIFFVAVHPQNEAIWHPRPNGFDAVALNNMMPAFDAAWASRYRPIDRLLFRLTGRDLREMRRRALKLPYVIGYEEAVDLSIKTLSAEKLQFPGVMPNWDNTPRSGRQGVVFQGSTPDLYRRHLRQVIALVQAREFDKRLVMVKSWNEWAEGNYLEPDRLHGHGYLEATEAEVWADDYLPRPMEPVLSDRYELID